MKLDLPPLPLVPAVHSDWTHVKSGREYRVYGVARIESTLAHVVVYGAHPGELWVRPHGEFMDGRFGPAPVRDWR
jgi:hypothetical protein